MDIVRRQHMRTTRGIQLYNTQIVAQKRGIVQGSTEKGDKKC